MRNLNRSFASRFPDDLADRCVKCGLCLPHCPTYKLASDEGESPRGRISLMQGLARGQLEASPALIGHLDRCLTCRTCERVCPAQVPYGQLIDSARGALVDSQRARASGPRLIAWVLGRRQLAKFLTGCVRIIQRTGLLSLASRVGPAGLQRSVAYLPRLTRPWNDKARAPVRPGQDAVHLFLGCLTPLVDPLTLEDAVRVVTAMGVGIHRAVGQACCGALHKHAGQVDQAAALELENRSAFSAQPGPILGLASGCTAMLAEYDSRAAGEEQFSGRVRDIIAWIADRADRLPPLTLPTPVTCVVHDPCTLRNVLRDHRRLEPLLDRIENLSWRTLDPPHSCCGAAGSYMLSQPAIADSLAEQHLAALQADPPDFLLSGNIGCALHLQATAARLRLPTRVLHPISLIAMALPVTAENTPPDVV